MVNLGPVSTFGEDMGPDGGYGYNPRCLKRDVGPGVASKYTNWKEVLSMYSLPFTSWHNSANVSQRFLLRRLWAISNYVFKGHRVAEVLDPMEVDTTQLGESTSVRLLFCY